MRKKTVMLVLCMMLLAALVVIFSNETVKATNGSQPQWELDWTYRKKITINHTMIEEDLQNFPVLIHKVSSDFKDHAQSDGDDFVFISEDNTYQYNHEIEHYDDGVGELFAWVNITEISSTVDTIFYIFYGNPTCNNQQNATGTWDSNYLAVYHMSDTSDSTGTYDLTNNGASLVEGKIGSCYDFESSEGDWLQQGTLLDIFPEDISVEAWFTRESSNSHQTLWVKINSGSDALLLNLRDYDTLRLYGASGFGTGWMHEYGDISSLNTFYYSAAIGENNEETILFVNSNYGYGSTSYVSPADGSYRNFFIGKYNYNAGDIHYFDGKIDEVRVSQIARSTDWINTSYLTMNEVSGFLKYGPQETNQPPNANFTYTPSYPENDDVIQFTDTSTKDNGTIISWWWNFGDGYYSDLQNPVHCYYIDGSFTVKLVVTDNEGFKDSIQKTIIIGTVNNPPYMPSNPNPVDGATSVPTNQQLSWSGGDPDGDPVTYDVYFGTNSIPPKIVSNLSDLFYNPGILNYDTTYYWQIIAWDSYSASSVGPIWSFTTEIQPPPPSVVYVDDDYYDGGYNDGHTWGYDAFDLIQDGINAVSGSTVYVHSGTYYENVIINRIVNLTGEDKNTTIIDGDSSGDVVYIKADYVNISGFTMQNSGSGPTMKEYSGIRIRSDNISVSDNIISNNRHGILLSLNNTIIVGNVISNNSNHGIFIHDNSKNNIIVNNTIIKNDVGIRLNGKINSILDNIFEENGINIHGQKLSEWNTHIIENNTLNGRPIRFYKNINDIEVPSDTAQLLLANCSNFTIQNLNLNNKCENITLGYSNNIKIVNNTISNKKYNAITIHSSYDNIVFHNNFINNSQNVYFYDEYANIWNNSYPSGGNYWDDYTGIDNFKGSNQDIPGSDGIGDTPYYISGASNKDNYPFMNPNGWIPENQPPIADFTYTPTNPLNTDIIQFTDTSTDPDGSIVSWAWDFDDGNTSTSQNPTHQYNTEGAYNVSLTVTDNDGKSNTTEIMITVTDIPAVEQLDQEQTSYKYNYDFHSSRWCAQSFKPTLSTLTRVELFVGKKGVPPEDIVVSIHDSLTGADLTTVSKTAGEISSAMDWVEFNFTDISVTPETTYYIVAKTSGGNTFNGYCWGFHYNTPYTRGSFWRSINAGSTWSEYYFYDFCFKTYGV